MHVADIEIEKPKFDYLSFRPKDIVLDSGGTCKPGRV